jgi:hypothetical protein
MGDATCRKANVGRPLGAAPSRPSRAGPSAGSFFCILREPGPLVGNLEPRLFVERAYRLFGLLAGFLGLLSVLVEIGMHSLSK